MNAHRLIGARRDRAERYLILTIAAFAVTVAGTRWYLDLTGYPTVGGGELHVAHVLWGGLALFIAAVLPLLFVGRRALMASAILAGVGVGLFIDEVGKFLTTSNDYFYAPAAPIIYGTILLLVLLWVLVRRRTQDSEDATQAVIDALRDGVEGRLTPADRTRVTEQLQASREATGPSDIDQLSDLLVTTLESPAMDTRLASEGWVARGDARRLLERLLPTRLERWLIAISLALAVLTALVASLLLIASTQVELDGTLVLVEDSGRLEFPTEPFWILLALGINVVVGLAAVVALVLLVRGRARAGMNVALVAMATNLVAGGLVTFYVAQFTALTSTVLGVIQLGLILDQRIRLARAHVDEPAD